MPTSTSHTATLMKPLLLAAAFAAILFASGCMIYTQNPPKRTISGQVINARTGQPVPFAVLWFYSERAHIGFSTNFGIDATAYADKNGRYMLTERLNDHVTVVVFHNGVTQQFTLPDFPLTNTLNNMDWRVQDAPAQPAK